MDDTLVGQRSAALEGVSAGTASLIGDWSKNKRRRGRRRVRECSYHPPCSPNWAKDVWRLDTARGEVDASVGLAEPCIDRLMYSTARNSGQAHDDELNTGERCHQRAMRSAKTMDCRVRPGIAES